MAEYRVVEDRVDQNWRRWVKVLAPMAEGLKAYPVPALAQVKRFEDSLRLHHLEASWPVREAIGVMHPHFNGDFYRRAIWPMVGWWIGDGGRVSTAMIEAGAAYALAYGVDPTYAFIRKIPAGAAEFVEIKGISLILAAWVPAGFIAVANGGGWIGQPAVGGKVESGQVEGIQADKEAV